VRTFKLTIAYDGTDYAGWQFQVDKRSVQEQFERALAAVTGQSIRVLASGRTDAGVHAEGQVVGFACDCALPCDVLRRALNANLPRDIAVFAVEEAPIGFHATHHARCKRYRYRIDNGPVRDVFGRRTSWHVVTPLDVEAMTLAAKHLLGTHDFSSFETSGSPRRTSVRTVTDVVVRGETPAQPGVAGPGTADPGGAEQARAGQGGAEQGRAEQGGVTGVRQRIVVEIEADGFLYNMVRTIVGSLVRVGRGAHPPHWIAEVLAARDRRKAGPTAPPQGLCLVHVTYD
jgi:tRNA pseudouridine38-40 synthase